MAATSAAVHNVVKITFTTFHLANGLVPQTSETLSVLCHNLMVDSMFEQSENVNISVVSSSSCALRVWSTK